MTDASFFGNDASMIGSAIVTVGLAVVSLYFKWLISCFKEFRESFREIKTCINDIVKVAQARHEDNLHRFEKISVALARLGSTNGTYDKGKNN